MIVEQTTIYKKYIDGDKMKIRCEGETSWTFNDTYIKRTRNNTTICGTV